ncbi:MAG: AI-2E family transporter [Eubacteriales bacterium]
MRIDKNKTYASMAYYLFLAIISSAAVILLFLNLKYVFQTISVLVRVLSPLIIGFVLAYLLNRPVKFTEKVLTPFFKKCKTNKPRRVVSIIITYVFILTIVVLIAIIVFPQLVESFYTLFESLPQYFSALQNWVINILGKFNIDTSSVQSFVMPWQDVVANLGKTIETYIPQVFEISIQFAVAIGNLLLGILFSIYLLDSKEKLLRQIKKVIYAVLNEERGEGFISFFEQSNKTFSNFISGKILESFLFTVASFVIMTIMGLPYALLISVIVGILNIIPFIGPFIGAAIGVLIIFIVNPTQALWFLIMIIILQQIDGSILGPKILGDSTGLSAFWVLVAIILGGGLFGFWGMVVSVPVFAVIYSGIASLINDKINGKIGRKSEKSD